MASCMDALAEMALGTETENQLVHVMDEALGRVIESRASSTLPSRVSTPIEATSAFHENEAPF